MRLLELFRLSRATHDRLLLVLIALVLIVGGWLTLLPVNRFVQRATLARFHMQTPQFWLWAAQQPIPSMYNCENKAQVVADLPKSESLQPIFADAARLNHFPYRLFTFGDGRFDYLKDARPKWLCVQSHYQRESLSTVWQATPLPGGGHLIREVSTTFDP